MSYRISVYRESTVYRKHGMVTVSKTIIPNFGILNSGIPKNSIRYRYGVLSYRNFRYGIRYDLHSRVYRTEPPVLMHIGNYFLKLINMKKSLNLKKILN